MPKYGQKLKLLIREVMAIVPFKANPLVPWAGISRVFHGYGDRGHSTPPPSPCVQFPQLHGRVFHGLRVLVYTVVN